MIETSLVLFKQMVDASMMRVLHKASGLLIHPRARLRWPFARCFYDKSHPLYVANRSYAFHVKRCPHHAIPHVDAGQSRCSRDCIASARVRGDFENWIISVDIIGQLDEKISRDDSLLNDMRALRTVLVII